MFSYYGRKAKIAKHYPTPKHDTIIEPFAGAAAYSLHDKNWEKNIVLRDVNPTIIRLWKWLQHTTPELIRCLPDLEPKQSIPDLPPEAKCLVSFWSNQGTAFPRNVAGSLGGYYKWAKQREEIARSLYKIKHFDIALGDYRSLPNIKATWFIDPPYQKYGSAYRYCDKIDYDELSEWCKSRRGQVMVCEMEDADWLPFEPLCINSGQRTKRQEVLWCSG